METQVRLITTHASADATSERSGFDTGTTQQAATNVVGIELADAHDGRTGVRLLLDRLLELKSDGATESGDLAAFSEDSFPTIHSDDLPSPAFHDDDLPAPSFHDDDLPAPTFHDDDLPADLTTMGLNRLLGLQLSSVDLPTVGEVTRAAFQITDPKRADPEVAEAPEDDGDSSVEQGEATPYFTNAGDLSFIDPLSLTEQALEKSANSGIDDQFEAELFGSGLLFFDDDDPFADDFFDPGGSSSLPSSGSGGGSGGGGTNVINGTSGNDNLIGTAGNDLIHGFAGDDIIDGGGGSDRLDGGLGNDVLVWDALDTSIDGKNGIDTLRVDSANADITGFGGSISSLEIVDLQTGASSYGVTLTAQDVLDVTDNANTLTITGDAMDSLNANTGWTYTGVDGSGNEVYTQAVGPHTATLVVDPTITIISIL